jgi:hypothetical protein
MRQKEGGPRPESPIPNTRSTAEASTNYHPCASYARVVSP